MGGREIGLLFLGGLGSHGKSAELAFDVNVAPIPIWKRVLDIFCVLITLPGLLPMLFLIAIVIMVGSKGAVLFKQERVGLLGKRFIIFKFRTMIAGTDTAIHETHVASLIETDRPMTKLDAYGDARLIPFGRILRAAGLDELPQLINVLRGEMSSCWATPVPAQRIRQISSLAEGTVPYAAWSDRALAGFRQEPNDLQ